MAKRKPRFEISTITSIYEKRVPDRVKELAAKHINQESLRLITNIQEDMRKRIQKILRKGEREGRSVSAIASRLLKTGLDKGVFRSARSRAFMIARTELHRARQQAAFDVYRANKILQVKWVSICDDRLCKKCRKRHNKIFNINRLRTPPPLHPRCRCRCIPKGMKADIKPKKQDKQKYRYVITLQKAAYPGNMGFAEIYKFYQGATQEAIHRYENFLNRGRIRAAVAELERFVGYELHPSIWRRLRGGKYETVHRHLMSLEKARPYVRFRNRKLEHVRGYAGKLPLADLSPSERVEMFLDPARPDVKKAKEVALAVAEAGGRALYVGGCVRDALLGRVSKDIDIDVYGLSNEKIKEISSKLGTVNLVGRQFPVFKLSGPGMDEPIDICLPRRDSKVGEGHAKGFIAEADPFMSVKEAARRRDLTINTLAYDPLTKEVIDEYEGLKDIEDRKLRVTDPETFGDDSLRVLRVMQFAARLGFTPDVQLVKICRAIDLSDISRERIFEEMEKLLLKSKYPSIGLGLIPALGISKIMPEIDALRGVKQDPEWHKEGTVWKHTLMVVDAAAKLRGKFKNNKDKMALMFAALCHDLGKPMTTEVREGRITTYGHDDAGVEPTRQLLGRISNDSEIQGKVEALVREHMKPTFFHHDKVPDSAIRRLAKKVDIPLLVALSMADKLGRGGPTPKLESERWLLKKYKELKLDQPKALDPVVLGRHLIQLGMKPGPPMGGVLKQIYEAQLEGKFATPEDGVAYAQQQGWLAKGQVYDVDDLMKSQVFVPAHQSEGHMVQGYYRDDPRERQQNTGPPLLHYTDLKELGQIYQKEYLDAEIKDPQGNKITFSQSNFLHITKLDTGTLDKYRSERLLWIKDVIQNPDLIVKDKRDPQARLFIKWYGGEPYLFVCRVQGNQFHSVTAYPLESRGKLEALLRQEKIYSRPGFELKKSEIINVKGHLTRTKSGKLTPVRPYVQNRQQLREQLRQDKRVAAKKHGVELGSLHFEGPFLSQVAGKYIYQWTIHQPGHPSDGSTVSGSMYDTGTQTLYADSSRNLVTGLEGTNLSFSKVVFSPTEGKKVSIDLEKSKQVFVPGHQAEGHTVKPYYRKDLRTKKDISYFANLPEYTISNLTQKVQEEYDIHPIWKDLGNNERSSGLIDGTDYIIMQKKKYGDVETEIHELGHYLQQSGGLDSNALERLVNYYKHNSPKWLEGKVQNPPKDWLDVDGNPVFAGRDTSNKEVFADIFKWFVLGKLKDQNQEAMKLLLNKFRLKKSQVYVKQHTRVKRGKLPLEKSHMIFVPSSPDKVAYYRFDPRTLAPTEPSKEKAVVYDDEGKVFFEKEGEAGSVDFTNKEAKLFKGKTLSHNHPSNTSFSEGDIKFAMKYKLKEMRVITDEGTYFIKLPPKVKEWGKNDWGKWNEIQERNGNAYQDQWDFDDSLNEAENFLQNFVNRGEMELIAAGKKLMNETWKRFAEKKGWEYGFNKNDSKKVSN